METRGDTECSVGIEMARPAASAAVAEKPSVALPDGQHTVRRSAFTADVTLESLRGELVAFAAARDWDQFHSPRNLALAMVGEVGEVAEVFQWKSDADSPAGLGNWKDAKLVHLGEELADVLLYLVRLADRCRIDLAAAARRKVVVNGLKYPADRVRGSSAKYDEYRAGHKAGKAAVNGGQ